MCYTCPMHILRICYKKTTLHYGCATIRHPFTTCTVISYCQHFTYKLLQPSTCIFPITSASIYQDVQYTCAVVLLVQSSYCIVDPQLSGPQISGRFDHQDWVLTVQLQHLVESVHYIRVLEISSE